MDALLLSVVVPTHQTRELTLRCLACLHAAAPHPDEVLVVDDGSQDGTAEAIAASYPAVRVVRHAEARGFTAAANAGLAAAGGDVLVLLNSDTEVEGQALGALLAAFAADPALGVAGATLHYPDGSPQWSGGPLPGLVWLFALASGLPRRLRRWRRWRRVRPLSGTQARRPVEWVTGAAMALRRKVWHAVGPLDEGFAFYGQDLDFCARAGRAGWRVAVVPAARVMHHHGATIATHASTRATRLDEALLWADLVRWVVKERGNRAARRAARWMAAGGFLQRLTLLVEGLPSEGRAAAQQRREALRAAAAAARHAARAT